MAPAIAVAAAPTAPSPPMLPVAGKPASTSLFSKPANPATPPATSDSATGETAPPERPAPRLWNPAETFASIFKPAAAADRDDQPRGDARGQSQPTTPRPPAAATGTASPSGTAGSQRRFDPDLGAAGLVVSDGRPGTPADRPTPRDDAEFLGSAPAFPAPPATTPEPQAKESVSLVSWLSQSYSELVGSDGFAGGEGIADAGSGVCVTDCCCPTWQVQVDALFFWQGNIPSRPLYVYTDTQATALDANQLQNRAAIAPRYAVIYNRDDCRAIEVNYFAVWGFNAVQQVGSPEPVVDSTGAGAISAAGLLGTDISGIGFARATSTAHIKSFEANLRRRQEDGFIQWISGFRWIEWGQTLALEDTIYSGNKPSVIDSFQLSTINNLYGWQLGGDATLWNAGRWVRINGVGKAGIYYNHQANQNSAYFNGIDPPTRYAEAKDVVSFVGETGINASVALTKWLSWRAGYSFFWLGGVATPTRQLTETDVLNEMTAVNATGSVFLQAATTGLEARW